MPTGYTADIEKDISFQEYALLCARAFGACIDLRDEPLSAEIPEFEPSPYHKHAIQKEQLNMMIFKDMSVDEADQKASEEYEQQEKYRQNRIQKNKSLEDKYYAMLDKVHEWTPPTDEHVELKKFMVSQIEGSIKSDCDTRYISKPEKKTGAEWLEQKIKACKEMIEYHEKQYADEVSRTNERNEWVKALRESLV